MAIRRKGVGLLGIQGKGPTLILMVITCFIYYSMTKGVFQLTAPALVEYSEGTETFYLGRAVQWTGKVAPQIKNVELIDGSGKAHTVRSLENMEVYVLEKETLMGNETLEGLEAAFIPIKNYPVKSKPFYIVLKFKSNQPELSTMHQMKIQYAIQGNKKSYTIPLLADE